MLTLKAYAKLNLVLEVLGRRGDGYHEIASVMQTIGLCDVLTFEAADKIELSCSEQRLETSDNLVLKAARVLQKATGEKAGAAITLEKKIPHDAGLGGGSSDAASALKGLNRLWGLGLAVERLAEIGSLVGSDVPFFIYGGTCLVQGRGEIITPLPDIKRAWFVLLQPRTAVPVNKTAALYAMLKPGHFNSSGRAAGAADLFKNGAMATAELYNTFDSIAGEAYNGLQMYREAFAKAGAGEVHLAGSGPLLFSMFGSREEARAVQGRLLQINMDSILAHGVPRDEAGY